jgi:hypothetical protein
MEPLSPAVVAAAVITCVPPRDSDGASTEESGVRPRSARTPPPRHPRLRACLPTRRPVPAGGARDRRCVKNGYGLDRGCAHPCARWPGPAQRLN